MRPVLLRRVGAYVLDIVLLFAVLAPAGYAVQRALGVSPSTAREIYGSLVLTFSIPAWTYFTLADRSRRGATLGKRLLGLRTASEDGGPVRGGRALARTAVKMVPWELAHASSFLFAPALGEFSLASWIGLGASYALSAAYLAQAWRTGGHRSVHDVVAGTRVEQSLGGAVSG
ncbi:RDD family protein [Rubrivirga sp. IMCC43871]|uniref:RDD family protein n=1 Tax=Rubrivirga sp. IMCC43871 TaxID=3391575 RepID=UPI0039902267